MRYAVLVGATGLTGKELARQLAAMRHPVPTRALVRKQSSDLPESVEQIVVKHFDDPDALQAHIPVGSWVFCTVGTTMRIAGSQEAFRAVDLDIPVALAHAAKAAGVAGMSIVSSAGAKATGFFFYTRTKGEMELALQAASLQALHIFRPSFLIGNRQEQRLGESLAIALARLLTPLCVGPLAKYAPISVNRLAKVMIEKAQKGSPGMRIYEGEKLMK